MDRPVAEVCHECARFVRPVQRANKLFCPKCNHQITPMSTSIRKAA